MHRASRSNRADGLRLFAQQVRSFGSNTAQARALEDDAPGDSSGDPDLGRTLLLVTRPYRGRDVTAALLRADGGVGGIERELAEAESESDSE
jgi:hypothetical protein